jgi:putative colanic acid biosynthesis acetyltransferase WcaF
MMWRWRRLILRLFGARIGTHCDIRGTAKIWYPPNLIMEDWTMLADGVICYNVAPITLRTGSLVSQRAHLCAASHDIYDSDFPLKPKPIEVGRQCWIAAEAFVGPGVTLGEGAVLGARAAAFENLTEWTIYRGNPATVIRVRPRQPMMQVSQRAQNAASKHHAKNYS